MEDLIAVLRKQVKATRSVQVMYGHALRAWNVGFRVTSMRFVHVM